MQDELFQGNLFSDLVFLIWLPWCVLAMRRHRPTVAVPAAFLGSLLLLPERVDFKIPGLPLFDKLSLTSIAVLIGLLWHHRTAFAKERRPRLLRWATLALVVSGLGTAMANGDPVVYGPVHIQGMTLWDGVHFVIRDFLIVILPFAFGATLFRTAASARDLLGVLVVWALIYTAPALIEVRLSPQLHNWIYGFMQHSFQQMRREGGFRPIIFMEHGLAVALFFAAGVTAAVGLVHSKAGLFRRSGRGAPTWLFLVLILCKSKAALAYAVLTWGVTVLAKPRFRMVVCTGLAVMVLAYPFVRSAEWFPAQEMVDFAEDVAGPERAASLAFRLTNEAALVTHALERPLFGWGTYGRDVVYDTWSADSTVVRDGFWIIQLGKRGYVGFFFAFGLLVWPIFRLRRALREPNGVEAQLLATVALLATIHTVDLLPNGMFSSMAHFFAGALYGLTLPLGAPRPLKPDASARTRPPAPPGPAGP